MGYSDPLYLLVDLFDMHKRCPDCFAAARRDLFTALHKQQANPVDVYKVMVCFKAAKAVDMSQAAQIYSTYMEKLEENTREEALEDQSTKAFREFIEQNPSSSEAKEYDV